LRDDERLDPHGRLADAVAHLHEMYAALNSANSAARAYQATIGHVRIEG
jgi:hypothetical protein